MANKGRAIFMVLTDLRDPAYEEEFNAWYDTEHLPELLGLPGVLDGARYVAIKGGPKYLAMYELESVDQGRARDPMYLANGTVVVFLPVSDFGLDATPPPPLGRRKF